MGLVGPACLTVAYQYARLDTCLGSLALLLGRSDSLQNQGFPLLSQDFVRRLESRSKDIGVLQRDHASSVSDIGRDGLKADFLSMLHHLGINWHTWG